MHSYNYIPIQSVITRLPQMLKEEESDTTLTKWALDCYLQNEKDINNLFETRFCLSKITNHVGALPTGFKMLWDSEYFAELPDTITDSPTGQWIQETIDGNHVIIFQSILYQDYKNRGQQMKWAGQDSDVVWNGCLNVICQDCINYSIDRQHKTITTSVEDGYVAMLYKTSIKNDDGDFLIPDDKELINALSHYCIAQSYLNAGMRRESGAMEMYDKFILSSNLLFSSYEKRNLLRKFDVDGYVKGMHQITNTGKIHQVIKNIRSNNGSQY